MLSASARFTVGSCRRNLSLKHLVKDNFYHGTRLPLSSKWRPVHKSLIIRTIHVSGPQRAPPLIAMLLKTGGVKVMKGLSIVFGRSFRKLYSRLPESVQSRVGKHKVFFSVMGITLPFIGYYSYTHYETCPITGRKRWITFTRDQVVTLADLDCEQLLNEYQGKLLNEDHPIFLKNMDIVSKLVAGNSDLDTVKNTQWKLHVIDDPTVSNACVLPNGNIFVFTGMLKLMNTWEEMAVILGHEMSHAILGHAQEQQSYLAFGELLAVPLLAFIWFMFEDFAAFLVYTIQHYTYPLIFEYGFNLPYSRLLESEADEVGLMLSSKACYDPRWSVLLWEKMAMEETLKNESNVEEFDFLSTHPASHKRSITLEEKLPKVMELRKQCNCPDLPTNVDPQAAAHLMRKCVANIREQKTLTDQLNGMIVVMDIEKTLKDEEKGPESEENVRKMQMESEDILRKLTKLQLEYKELVHAPELSATHTVDNKKESNKQVKDLNAFEKLWYKIVGSVKTTGNLSDTLFEKENCKLHTVNLQKSAFGTSRNS